jgi:hypothetical protein
LWRRPGRRESEREKEREGVPRAAVGRTEERRWRSTMVEGRYERERVKMRAGILRTPQEIWSDVVWL